MKKLIAVLFLLLAVQSYGVYGRAQSDRIMYKCTMEVGPLCYAWEANAIGKILGTENAEEMEAQLEKMKDAWDEQFISKIEDATKEKSGVEKALDNASKKLDRLSKSLRGVIESLDE